MESRFEAADVTRLAGLIDEHVLSTGAPLSEGPGTRIGRYKLLQLIGEGGFGSVFMAEQVTPVVRKVALKIIKLGMDTRQVIARFEAERQALAMMDHPNIAKVLDAGATETGRPYFVMELVRGAPITAFCDENKLAARQRLELSVPVCAAVQHAHQKGIIHRDLKPNNVLVTMHDDKPVPMIIDFGIAKATNARLTEHTLFTEFRQFIGTPQYMSPEQAQMSGLDVDTRSDIYSLGVLLYELLAGTTPFDPRELRSAANAEMQRIIREVEPPAPSTRLSAMAAGRQSAVAQCRRSDPAALGRMLRGDLDWIILKCLEKDRGRRYETAGALARDIHRYLDDEPVEASPPSPAYRMRKFLRKHRGAVLGITAVVMALALGLVGTSLGMAQARRNLAVARDAQNRLAGERDSANARAVEAREARNKEAAERRQAQLVTDALESVFQRLDPWDGRNGTDVKSELIAEMDLLAAKLARNYSGEPLVRARLRDTVGWVELRLGRIEKAQVLLQQAADEQQRFANRDDAQTLRVREHLAVAFLDAGKPEVAVEKLKDVLNDQVRGLGRDHPLTRETRHYLGAAFWEAGRAADTIRLLEPERNAHLLDTDTTENFIALKNLSGGYWLEGRTAEATQVLEELRARETRTLAPDHPILLFTLNDLSEAYYAAGYVSKAIGLLQEVREKKDRVLGPAHPSSLITANNLAMSYEMVGRHQDAAELLERLNALAATSLAPDHPDRVRLLNNLAITYRSCGKVEEAIELFKRVRDQRVRIVGPDHLDTLASLNELAKTYRMAGRVKEAVEVAGAFRGAAETCLETKSRAVGRSPTNAVVAADRGALLARMGRFGEASRDYAKAVDLDPTDHRYWHDGLLPLDLQLGQTADFHRHLSRELRQFADATMPTVAHRVAKDGFMTPLAGDDLRAAVQLAERALAADPESPPNWETKGMAEYRSGRYGAAIPWFERFRRCTANLYFQTEADLFESMSYERAGDHGQARRLLEQTQAAIETRFPKPGEQDLGDVGDWIFCRLALREAEGLIAGNGLRVRPADSTRAIPAIE